MQRTAYVFVNDKGWYFGDRQAAGVETGTFAPCFYELFQQAKLFSSIRRAKEFRDDIINSDIRNAMILMPIEFTHSKQDIFKAILKKD